MARSTNCTSLANWLTAPKAQARRFQPTRCWYSTWNCWGSKIQQKKTQPSNTRLLQKQRLALCGALLHLAFSKGKQSERMPHSAVIAIEAPSLSALERQVNEFLGFFM
ncbi:hypothetical protein EMIT0P294_30220 [Pseudomonas sp. IT-P294]